MRRINHRRKKWSRQKFRVSKRKISNFPLWMLKLRKSRLWSSTKRTEASCRCFSQRLTKSPSPSNLIRAQTCQACLLRCTLPLTTSTQTLAATSRCSRQSLWCTSTKNLAKVLTLFSKLWKRSIWTSRLNWGRTSPCSKSCGESQLKLLQKIRSVKKKLRNNVESSLLC